MNRQLNGLLAMIFFVFSPSAFADNILNHSYVGIDFGRGYYLHAGEDSALGVDRSPRVLGAHVGYAFSPYVSAQLSYQYLGHGEATYDEGVIKGSFRQVALSVRAGMAFEAFYPYLKIGGAGWQGRSHLKFNTNNATL